MDGTGAETDPRTLPKTPDGVRQAWSVIEERWSATFERARALPDGALHERVDGEWSFVETQRHLVFATDAWIRRPVLGEVTPYHRLGLPPGAKVGERNPDLDVAPWGIDVDLDATLDEVMEARVDRMRTVRAVVDGLTPDGLDRVCAESVAPGFMSAEIPVGTGLDVVIGEEWAHLGYATRDLQALEDRA